MVGTGQAVHEVEEELRLVALRMGYPQAQIGVQPTGLTVALAPGETSTYQAISDTLGLDQADEVRSVLHLLLTRKLEAEQALGQLVELSSRPERYPTWLVGLGWVGFSVGIGLILQPDPVSLAVNAICAVIVWSLVRVSQRIAFVHKVLPTLAAFAVASLVFTADRLDLLDAPLRTILAPLAILLPGSALVTGISELPPGPWSPGVSRLGYGVVRLMLFAAGIVAAVALFQVAPGDLNDVRVNTLGWWSAPLGLLLIGVGVSLMQGVKERLMLWITLNVAVSFLAQTIGQQIGGAPLGGFLGAGRGDTGLVADRDGPAEVDPAGRLPARLLPARARQPRFAVGDPARGRDRRVGRHRIRHRPARSSRSSSACCSVPPPPSPFAGPGAAPGCCSDAGAAPSPDHGRVFPPVWSSVALLGSRVSPPERSSVAARAAFLRRSGVPSLVRAAFLRQSGVPWRCWSGRAALSHRCGVSWPLIVRPQSVRPGSGAARRSAKRRRRPVDAPARRARPVPVPGRQPDS